MTGLLNKLLKKAAYEPISRRNRLTHHEDSSTWGSWWDRHSACQGLFQQPALTRREAIGLTAGLALAACRRSKWPKPLISIVKAASYQEDLAAKVRSILRHHKVAVRGKRVVLKPNLVEFDPAASINTSPLLVEAAMEAFLSMGAASVQIAEGPGHRRNTLEMAEAAGYFTCIPNFEACFTDLNLDDVSRVRLERPLSGLKSLYLPHTALRADLLVSMPKMKTHHWVGATLSMKNLFGLVPGAVYGWPKNVLHWAGIPRCIVDLHATLPSHFAIVDGVVGMEGNGPIQGKPKALGAIVAGEDMVAVDATCCRVMGIDPAQVEYLKLAETRGQTVEANVEQIGEPVRAVRTNFELIEPFQALRWKDNL
jgi:uncharacterized protein (DUF362 family)